MNHPTNELIGTLNDALAGLSRACKGFSPDLSAREVGTITTVSMGIAKVSGLPSVGFKELVELPGDLSGIAFNLDEDEIGVHRPLGVSASDTIRSITSASGNPAAAIILG